MDPTKIPIVLILEKGRIREPNHCQNQKVLSGFQKFRDIEFGRQLGILRQTNPISVEMHMQDALGGSYLQDDSSAAHCGRQLEPKTVNASGVGRRNLARFSRKRHLDIGIMRAIPTLEAPCTRQGDLFPITVDATFLPSRLRNLGRIFKEAEFPETVEREKRIGLSIRAAPSGLRVRKRYQRGTHGKTSDLLHFRTLPSPEPQKPINS